MNRLLFLLQFRPLEKLEREELLELKRLLQAKEREVDRLL